MKQHLFLCILLISAIVFGDGQWIKRSPNTTVNLLCAVAKSPEALVAVGSNVIVRSVDGKHWMDVTPAQFYNLRSVTWTGTVFFAVGYDAVGYGGKILVSSDGIRWDERPSGVTSALIQVTWTGSKAIAVGYEGTIIASVNGQNWTPLVSGVTFPLFAVTGNDSRIVVGGDSGVLTSTDGNQWTLSKSLSGTMSITWNGAQFVAVGQTCYNGFYGLHAPTVFTSPDGSNWTNRSRAPLTAEDSRFLSVIWDGAKFVAVGTFTNNKQRITCIKFSTDGISWSDINTEIHDGLYSILWTSSSYYAVGERGCILYSEDCVSWMQLNQGVRGDLKCVGWSGTQLEVFGRDGVQGTSKDGIDWDTRERFSTICNFYAIAYDSDNIAYAGEYAHYTVNYPDYYPIIRLTGWEQEWYPQYGTLYGAAWGDSTIVAVGTRVSFAKKKLLSSWVTTTSAVGYPLRSVIWADSLYIAVGTAGCIITSPDGNNWHRDSSGTSALLYGVVKAGNQLYAVGDSGMILTSPMPGKNWIKKYSGVQKCLTSIASTGARLFCIGYAGTIISSTDGTMWTQMNSGTTADLNSIAWTGARLVAVGQSGTILTYSDQDVMGNHYNRLTLANQNKIVLAASPGSFALNGRKLAPGRCPQISVQKSQNPKKILPMVFTK